MSAINASSLAIWLTQRSSDYTGNELDASYCLFLIFIPHSVFTRTPTLNFSMKVELQKFTLKSKELGTGMRFV